MTELTRNARKFIILAKKINKKLNKQGDIALSGTSDGQSFKEWNDFLIKEAKKGDLKPDCQDVWAMAKTLEDL